MTKMNWSKVNQEKLAHRREYEFQRSQRQDKQEAALLKLKAMWERLAQNNPQLAYRNHQDHRSHLKFYDCEEACKPKKHVHVLCGQCQIGWLW